MAESGDASGINRSYSRNLTWCRFWLGVGLGIVAFTFTFVVDQTFENLNRDRDMVFAENAFIMAGDLPVGDCVEELKIAPTGPMIANASADRALIVDAISWILGGAAGICLSTAWIFRSMYLLADRALSKLG